MKYLIKKKKKKKKKQQQQQMLPYLITGDFFLTLFMPNFLNGIIHNTFLAFSVIILGISRWEAEVGQPTV